MADPHLLYIVTAVVVLALVAWVIVVLARAPALPPVTAKKRDEAEPAVSPAPGATPEEAKPAEKPASKPTLDAHLEIQDEKPAGDKAGEG